MRISLQESISVVMRQASSGSTAASNTGEEKVACGKSRYSVSILGRMRKFVERDVRGIHWRDRIFQPKFSSWGGAAPDLELGSADVSETPDRRVRPPAASGGVAFPVEKKRDLRVSMKAAAASRDNHTRSLRPTGMDVFLSECS